MGNKVVGERIEYRRKQLGLTLDDIAQEIGVAKSTVQRYERGTIETIKLPVIEAIAKIMSVNPAWICGKTDNMEPEQSSAEYWFPSNLSSLDSMPKIPLIGRIACGEPILAEENIEDYVDLPRHIRADFALTCRGNSMINAGIREGDIVYIRKQERVDNGQIAAVLIDDEATLKRFYYNGDSIRLMAENPSFPTKEFVGEEMNSVHIIGLAVGYTHALEQEVNT